MPEEFTKTLKEEEIKMIQEELKKLAEEFQT